MLSVSCTELYCLVTVRGCLIYDIRSNLTLTLLPGLVAVTWRSSWFSYLVQEGGVSQYTGMHLKISEDYLKRSFFSADVIQLFFFRGFTCSER